jgi:hypothetical protein
MPHRRIAGSAAPALILALGTILAACTSAGGPAASPSSPPAGPTSAPAGEAPDGSTSGPATGPGDTPAPTVPAGDLVVPKPGQLDVHPIAADAFSARVDGRHVVLTIAYTSGVEPCSILDTIIVERGEGTFAVTLREGHGPGDQVCIMIARMMQTQVDLGELQPGTYTITDTMRGADPIQVVVS